MVRKNNPKFAIIGCGTAGLTTAICLARNGFGVTLFEQFNKPKAVGAGILLQPIGLVVLKRLGLLEEVEQVSARVDALIGCNHKHKNIMDVHYSDFSPNIYGLGVHRGSFFSILYQAAVQLGANIECGTDIKKIEKNDDQYRLYYENGVFEGFDAVIVANGTQSALRSELNVKQKNIPYSWGALWSILPDPGRVLKNVLTQRYTGAAVMIGILPTGNHPELNQPCVSFFWSLLINEYDAWRQTDFQVWKEQVLNHWPEIEGVLGSLKTHENLTFATYGDVVMRQWHDRAMVCIGDAAHGMSPQLGMGTNLAMLDAITLADCVVKYGNVVEAFQQYSKLRCDHLRYYQFASRWLTPFFQSYSKTAGFLRDLSLPIVNKMPWAYKEALRTISGVKTGLLFDRSICDLEW